MALVTWRVGNVEQTQLPGDPQKRIRYGFEITGYSTFSFVFETEEQAMEARGRLFPWLRHFGSAIAMSH
jgi:hypothetical protein